MTGTRYTIEVQPSIPARLNRLEELANNLLYTWDRRVRGLFVRLDPALWETCGHNPKLFLRRVSQQRLNDAAQDRVYVEDYNRALSAYDTYHREGIRSDIEQHLKPGRDLVAYFCAEFGLHESLPIYSGGLGILAGDHCKAASDLGLPFVAVGLLYRQGYFVQTIDGRGKQIAHYTPADFRNLPISPAHDAHGKESHVHVDLPGRRVRLKVWHAKAGHIDLYFLDSDVPHNSEADRAITYQLYGGDIHTRIQQEIVLGIGGVRALRALGLAPTVWHINEGHAAFMVLERCREYVAGGMEFDSALEQTATATVFTTHTPVPAGHDIFDHHLMDSYFSEYSKQLGIDMGRFLSLGGTPSNLSGFNQTALALRSSRFHNGVSRIHGGVASRMESEIWPQIPPNENPIGYVTNGVHVPTFLAREWIGLFDMRFGGEWRNELTNPDYWRRLEDIPDYTFWSLRQSLKAELLEEARDRAMLQYKRNGAGAAQVKRVTKHLNPEHTDVLVLGFARRFATYKRATLLFSDPERLARLLNDPKRPVVLIFAGKAHPSDLPGQHLIETIQSYSRRPEFEGKIILLEGYDMALGRKLVTGVDVWINSPAYPLEASGTSGQKAGINGVINLSVLDGWWDEGYNGENGWAITPHGPEYDPAYRDREEGQELLDIIEREVIPLYYERDGRGYPDGWVRMSKASMCSLIPRFNANRMLRDYIKGFYGPASRQSRAFHENEGVNARELSRWKKKILQQWPGVQARRADVVPENIREGEALPIQIAVKLNGLAPADVCVECLIGAQDKEPEFTVAASHTFTPGEAGGDGETLYRLELKPPLPGLQHYKIRLFPAHPLLSHRFETGCMLWV